MPDKPSFEFPSNIVAGSGELPALHGEGLFLSKVFGELEKQLESEFSNWSFTVHYRHFSEKKGAEIQLYKNPECRNALILLADEHERFPLEATAGFDVVFRQYLNHSERDHRIHPFPVGYHEAAGMIAPVPFSERNTRLFFSGYLNRNRLDLYKQFRKVWWLPRRNIPGRHLRELGRRMIEKLTHDRDFSGFYPDSIIRFTEWFAKGMPPAEYAAVLADTRIAVCPTGFTSAETIRHWEALRLGCVIITDPLPANPFYENSPLIVMNDWSQFHQVIRDLYDNPDKLEALHEATVSWWRNRCCEEAVATYMKRLLIHHGQSLRNSEAETAAVR